jgi:NAD+-dependent protein deacetylase SIR2
MGNENSSLIDEDTPPFTLEARDLKSVANLIKDGQAKDIVVLTGAGISTSAGSKSHYTSPSSHRVPAT